MIRGAYAKFSMAALAVGLWYSSAGAHAVPQVSNTSLTIPNVIIGYSTPVSSTGSFTITNAGNDLGLSTLGTIFNPQVQLFQNGSLFGGYPFGSGLPKQTTSPPISGELLTGGHLGSYSVFFSLSFGDDPPTAPGANENLGTTTITVSGAVLDHAAGSASVVSNPFDAFVSSTVTSTVKLSAQLNDSQNFARAGLQVSGTSANLSGGTIGVIAAGGSSNYTATFNAGSTDGAQTVVASFNTGDDQSLLGHGSIGTANISVNITGIVHDHASLSDQTVSVSGGHLTQGESGTFSYSLSDPSGAFRDGATITAISPNSGGYVSALTPSFTIAAGQSRTFTGTFTPGPASAGSHTFTITYGDQHQGYFGALSNESAHVTVNAIIDPLSILSDSPSAVADAMAAGRQQLTGVSSIGGNSHTINVLTDVGGTLTNINNALGASKGYLNAIFAPNDPITGNVPILFGFTPGSSSLTALESDLTRFDYTWFDSSGHYSLGNGSAGPGSDVGLLSAFAGYQLEIELPALPPGDPVFSFDFSNPGYGNLQVLNVAIVPEPSSSLVLLGFAGLALLRRRRRTV